MAPLFLIVGLTVPTWVVPFQQQPQQQQQQQQQSLPPPAATTCADPAPPPPPIAKARGLRVAVTDVQGTGLTPQLSAVITESLLDELRKLERVSVIGMGEIRELLDLEATRQLAGCSEESCLAGIADALGADAVISITVARLEGQSVVAIKRIDQRSGEVAHAFQQRLEDAGGEEVLASIGPAVGELFPDVPLRRGATRGVSPEMALRINPPPLEPWMFWTMAGVSGVSLVASGAFYAGSFVYADSLKQELDEAPGEQLALAQDTPQLAQTAAIVGVSTAAVVGAVAAGAWFFTDWRGLRDE